MLPKRLTWFGIGAATGALGAMWGYVKAREVRQLDADRVADAVVGTARTLGAGVRDLVADSRLAVQEAEQELRAGLQRPRAPVTPVRRRR